MKCTTRIGNKVVVIRIDKANSYHANCNQTDGSALVSASDGGKTSLGFMLENSAVQVLSNLVGSFGITNSDDSVGNCKVK